jgi:7-cyano-7-deazaguanine synthase
MRRALRQGRRRNDVESPADVPFVLLFGAGIESTTLVRQLLAEGKTVAPVYQHWGLHWEDSELSYARRFCDANACERLVPLTVVRYSQREILGNHWAVTGLNLPRAGDPPTSLEIPVRNLTLLITAARSFSWPELNLVMGTTADNHFRDGSRAYFDQCARLLSLEFGKPVRILTPLIGLNKTDVIRISDRETLSLSFSCLDPRNNLHCGGCYKCGRRKSAFRAAGVDDPTVYAEPG